MWTVCVEHVLVNLVNALDLSWATVRHIVWWDRRHCNFTVSLCKCQEIQAKFWDSKSYCKSEQKCKNIMQKWRCESEWFFCLDLGLSCSLSWASGVWRFAFPCLRERTSSWTRGGRNGLARWAPDAGIPASGPSHEGAPVTRTSESIAKNILHLLQSKSLHSHIKTISKYPTGAMHCLINPHWHNALASLLAYLKMWHDVALTKRGNDLPKSVCMSWNELSGGTLKKSLPREKVM